MEIRISCLVVSQNSVIVSDIISNICGWTGQFQSKPGQEVTCQTFGLMSFGNFRNYMVRMEWQPSQDGLRQILQLLKVTEAKPR